MLKVASVVLVIAPSDFRDEELFEIKEILEKAGIKVAVASRGVKEATGKLGGKIRVDIEIGSIIVKDFEGIVFIGTSRSSLPIDSFHSSNEISK